jgi:hypothetical protein
MRLRIPVVLMTSVFVAASPVACGGDDTTNPVAGADAGSDTGSGTDSGHDATAQQDGGTDAQADTTAPTDSGQDAVVADAPADAPTDSPTDAPGDSGDGGAIKLAGVSHVLLLSIDGLHEQDLAHFIADNPTSNLAKLAGTGLQYTSAYVNRLDGTPTNPSDSFPGLLALVTGASSKTHGGWYDVSYARNLYPAAAKVQDAGAPCTGPLGAEAEYDEFLDGDNSHLWGSATDDHPTHDVNVVRTRFPAANLPSSVVDGGCAPVYAHDYIRVNTIFNVAHAAGLHTAWSDKHPAYEMVSGPTGDGLDDFFAPEINSNAANLPGTGSDAGAGEDFTTKWTYAEVYDDYKVDAIIREIDGHYSDYGLPGAVESADAGSADPGVPAIFGMNFQALSVAQKSVNGGYTDGDAGASSEVADALAHTDASIGKMVAELQSKGLLASTLIIVTAKHGQSPIDHTLTQKVSPDILASVISQAAPVADHIEDDVALYWLTNASASAAAANAASSATSYDGGAWSALIDTAYFYKGGDAGAADTQFLAMFGDPTTDPHTPDVILKSQHGVIYSLSKKKWAEHGGFADDDSHVGLLLSNPGLPGGTVSAQVRTKQVAPTILGALHLDPTKLEGAAAESTAVLPGITF